MTTRGTRWQRSNRTSLIRDGRSCVQSWSVTHPSPFPELMPCGVDIWRLRRDVDNILRQRMEIAPVYREMQTLRAEVGQLHVAGGTDARARLGLKRGADGRACFFFGVMRLYTQTPKTTMDSLTQPVSVEERRGRSPMTLTSS